MEKQQKKEIFKRFKNRAFIAASTAAACSLAAVPAAFAADSSSLATDTSTIVTIVTSVLGLFTTFPLNIFLALTIIISSISIIKRLKK